MRQALPIDPRLPEIVRTLAERGALVIRADPGAGKTTRVPPALLDRPGEVVVLEPRRLAARLAARRVAAELGERPGETAGYQVRFEDVSSARTRIRFVTEGILARRLISDPRLAGVSTVILDEFHERHIHTDVTLALVDRLRRGGARPDLRLIVMSATLDAEAIARHLDAPAIEVPGRSHPVEIEHAPHEVRDLPLEQRITDAVERALAAAPAGHVLVFLPGAGEIARAERALAHRRDVLVLPLHGTLSPEEQDRAVAASERRKVILATNVAETSVTIEGVTTVIDSGLARIPADSPWSGLRTLRLEPISRASAAQRAGRAGRTGPGRAIRLYTRRDHDMRPAFTPPELLRLDLSETVLALAAAGVPDATTLPWFEAPPAAALDAARTLLRRLGATDPAGALTPTGARMLRLPLHPRLARLVVAGVDLGAAREACSLAAELSEGRRGAPPDPRVREQLLNAAKNSSVSRPKVTNDTLTAQRKIDPRDALLQAILAGHPDRVAKRRKPGSEEVVLFEGGTARLTPDARGGGAEWLVCLDADEQRTARGTLIRDASPIEPDWLLDLFPDEVRESVDVTWDPKAERAEVATRLLYGSLVLDETRGAPKGDALRHASAALRKQALAAGPEAFADREALAGFLARAAFARTVAPDLPSIGEAEARETLAELCEGRRSFAELRDARLLDALRGRYTHANARLLERLAPAEVTLASGRRARIRYEPGLPPRVASRLQDFFGLEEGPRIGGGKVPLVLELLAPSQRPVQVTTDLAGFWERHYPSIRRELSRRYPKHAWPEDPRR